jgi:tetratricopeptide (TPR) repeat protein
MFEEVHDLIHEQELSTALGKLISRKSGRLRDPFSAYPNHAWYLVGDVYLKLKNFSLAANAFKKSIYHRSEDSDAVLALGFCYSENNQPRKAKNVLAKGNSLFPRDVRIKYNLANAYFDLNDFEAASKLYTTLQKCKDSFIARAAKKNLQITKKGKKRGRVPTVGRTK